MMTVTEPGSIDIPLRGDLREYVLYELDRIIGELDAPFTTGLIPRTLVAHLRGVVDAWPNVQQHIWKEPDGTIRTLAQERAGVYGFGEEQT